MMLFISGGFADAEVYVFAGGEWKRAEVWCYSAGEWRVKSGEKKEKK